MAQINSDQPPHVAYVPMLDDDGVEHRGQMRCTCERGSNHRVAGWNDRLAEQRELLSTRDQ